MPCPWTNCASSFSFTSTSSAAMSPALPALKRAQTALASVWLSNGEREKSTAASYVWPESGPVEPGPLGRSAKTGGCRLPELDSIASAWKTHRYKECQHEVDPSTSSKLAADLARPVGQSTGRGFSLTRFKINRDYRSLNMRQQDVWVPWMGPNHTATLRTFYEIGHIVTHADPICGHLRWEDEYPFLIPNMANFGLHQRFSEDEARKITTFSLPLHALNSYTAPLLPGQVCIHKRLRCALFHGHGVLCRCRDSIAFNALRCCPRCDTDYAVNIVPDVAPGRPEGRLLVFTTWKCLGDGSASSGYWRPHQTSTAPSDLRYYELAHAHYQFESGDARPNTYEIDVDEIIERIASARENPREAPPEYTAVAEPGSRVVDVEKEDSM
ncbi:hypothetical protein B0T17DRAFT_309328 [Bombardia bombarda]|uniref:Uncharacterized protein n=1 Tax=Bombardia bombarda TaxID=252184 RepID=A0AA39WUX9_9PEZI|nr:hypothetical protein B0T17DRAFT_309328 [Bombardia bombarda]